MVPGACVALAVGGSRLAGAGSVAMQPILEFPEFRGTQAKQTSGERDATNHGEIHPMIREELSPVGRSGTDHADRFQALAHKMPVVAVFAAVSSVDLVTKAWAAATLTEPVRITDWLYLMLRHNSGLFLGAVPVSSGYWVGVCAAAGWFGWRALRSSSVPVSLCLAVVLAGVAGNAVGQAQGAVVDFIGIGPITGDMWLVVNVADIALVGGAFVLGLYLIRDRVRRAHRP